MAINGFVFYAVQCFICTQDIFFGILQKVRSYKGALRRITHLLVFGPQLLAVDQSNTLFLWDIDSEELILTIPFSTENSSGQNEGDRSGQFEISALLHPATYINKILFGSRNGSLQLWNVARQKLIHQFSGFGSCVTKITQAPVLHTVAIGHESGLIVIHNLEVDETLMKFYQEWGPINDLSFRTDDAATKGLLVSSSNNGHLAVWNLDEQRLEVAMRSIHNGPIVGAQFVVKQPLLVTNSPDNSLKVYVFDDLQTTGRMLYQREGHRLPPSKIRFYGHRGHYVLSAGLDSSLRAFFIYSERKNRNLGTASYNRKQAKKKGVSRDHSVMDPIVDFSFETTREKEWDNIVACHRNTPFATSWTFEKMKMGDHRFMHERFNGTKTVVHAECVSVSPCGNFVILGYNTGHVDRFNVQSGIHRCTYGVDSAPAHLGIVRGVLADGLNQVVVTGGADCRLNFWRFARGEFIGALKLSAPVNLLHLHRENSLLAVSLDNFHLIIVDLETKKVVRRFTAHSARITDMTFDTEGRRLFVSSMDSCIYVWDMLTGSLVDVFRTGTPCVSLTLSPTGEYLATAHVNDLGIYLWANLSMYSLVSLSPIDLTKIQEKARLISLPQIRSDEEVAAEDDDDVQVVADDEESKEDEEIIDYQYRSPEQLSSDLITLSTLPTSRWKNLLKLDLIKKRNKPLEPVEKPKQAPFFLPTISGLTPQFNLDAAAAGAEESTAASRNEARKFQLQFLSEFVRLLDKCDSGDSIASLQQHRVTFTELKSYGPSKIDAELRTLGPDCTGGTRRYLHLFLDTIDAALTSGRDFELVQSYLGLFANIHLDEIAKDAVLLGKCAHIAVRSDSCWNRLEGQFDRSLCLINYLRNALL